MQDGDNQKRRFWRLAPLAAHLIEEAVKVEAAVPRIAEYPRWAEAFKVHPVVVTSEGRERPPLAANPLRAGEAQHGTAPSEEPRSAQLASGAEVDGKDCGLWEEPHRPLCGPRVDGARQGG